jgi:hypothetical protein
MSLQDEWVYVEEISLDFSFAQSVLFKIYGGVIQETGHKTRGHICLTEEDKDYLNQTKGSFLYGELLPRGANKVGIFIYFFYRISYVENIFCETGVFV